MGLFAAGPPQATCFSLLQPAPFKPVNNLGNQFDTIVQKGFGSPSSPLLWGFSSRNDAPNYIVSSDIFNIDNTCFDNSLRCPKNAQQNLKNVLFSAGKSPPSKQELSKVRHNYQFELESTAPPQILHPFFEFKNPVFGPVHVQLREVGYLKGGGTEGDNSQDPSSSVDEAHNGASVSEIKASLKKGKYVKYGASNPTTQAKGYFPVVHFDQRFMVGRLGLEEWEKAIYLKDVLPVRLEKMGLSDFVLENGAGKVLESSAKGIFGGGGGSTVTANNVQTAELGLSRHLRPFSQGSELALRQKVVLHPEMVLSEDDRDVLNALVSDYADNMKRSQAGKETAVDADGRSVLKDILYNIHTARPLEEAIEDVLKKTKMQAEATGTVSGTVANVASYFGMAGKTVKTAIFKRLFGIDSRAVRKVEVKNIPAASTSAGEAAEPAASAKKPTRTGALYFLPTTVLQPSLPPQNRGSGDFLLPICSNVARDKSRVMELRVDTEDDKSLSKQSVASGRIHQSALVVVRETSAIAQCLCNGMHKGCSAPGWPPLEKPYFSEQSSKLMQADLEERLGAREEAAAATALLEVARVTSGSGPSVPLSSPAGRIIRGGGGRSMIGEAELRTHRSKHGSAQRRILQHRNWKSAVSAFISQEGEPPIFSPTPPRICTTTGTARGPRRTDTIWRSRTANATCFADQDLQQSEKHMVTQETPDYPPSLDAAGEAHEPFVRVGAEGPLDQKAIIREATQVRVEPMVVMPAPPEMPSSYYADQEKRGGPFDEHGQVFDVDMQGQKKAWENNEVEERAKLNEYQSRLKRLMVLVGEQE